MNAVHLYKPVILSGVVASEARDDAVEKPALSEAEGTPCPAAARQASKGIFPEGQNGRTKRGHTGTHGDTRGHTGRSTILYPYDNGEAETEVAMVAHPR